jgi:hypothetical protein
MKELKIKQQDLYNFDNIILDYSLKWVQHLLRIKDTCVPTLVYEYIPAGRRIVG